MTRQSQGHMKIPVEMTTDEKKKKWFERKCLGKETNQESVQKRDDLLDKRSKGVDGAFELGDIGAEETSHPVFVDHLAEQPEARLFVGSTQM